MIKGQRKIATKKSTASHKNLSSFCTLPMNLQKVYLLDKPCKGMVPVRIFLRPDQLTEIARLGINVSQQFQDWLAANTEAYQLLLRKEADDDEEELMELFYADEDNGDKIDADVHK
jgi:hypothetical protein